MSKKKLIFTFSIGDSTLESGNATVIEYQNDEVSRDEINKFQMSF